MKRNVLHARDSHIWTLRMLILLMLIITLYAIYTLNKARDEIKIRIPPNYAKGVIVSPNSFPKSYLYANAYLIFQNIQFWRENGRDDYPHNIKAYSCYVNVPMGKWLNNDYEQKKKGRELYKRTRNISVEGVYSDELVQEVGNGIWRVWLDVRIKEYLDDELFKNTVVRYPLQLSVDNRSCNPLGIAIDSMFATPTRIDNDDEK